jgi:hypothetical protein
MAPPTAMLPEGAADMTGSTLAVILIPPAGTICLAAWLALVFYFGRDQTPAQRIAARGGDSGPVRQRRRLASPGPGTTIAAARPPESPGEEIMHLIFARAGADHLQADEQDKQPAANRARRH